MEVGAVEASPFDEKTDSASLLPVSDRFRDRGGGIFCVIDDLSGDVGGASSDAGDIDLGVFSGLALVIGGLVSGVTELLGFVLSVGEPA